MTVRLVDRILLGVEQDGDRPCIAFIDSGGNFDWESRATFASRAAGAAAGLAADGLKPGAVLLIVSTEPEACARSVLAALLLGAIPLLVAPPSIQGVHSSLPRILRDVAVRTRASRLLMAPEVPAAALELPESTTVSDFRAVLDAQPAELRPPPRGDRPVALQLTSGTTGFPRIAVWRDEPVLAALGGMAEAMQLGSDDRIHTWTPLYHDMGLVNNFLLGQALGIPVALQSPLDFVRRPASWLQALAATGATTTWSPNFGFALASERADASQLKGVRLDHVRGFWNAAERVHASTLERFFERFGPLGVRRDALRTNFGCVEAIGGLTFTEGGEAVQAETVSSPALAAEGLARAPQPEEASQVYVGCGRAIPGAEVAAFDEAGQRLPDGRQGRIGFRGPAHFEHYLDDPAATACARQDGWVFPGDEGFLREGELYWTGRTAERMNLNGRKHDPSELEATLNGIEGVRPGCFVAFGVEDPDLGTEAMVVVCELDGRADVEPRELSGRVRAAIARELGLAVEHLLLVDRGTLAKTSSGKRRHRHFRELYLRGDLVAVHESRAGSL